MATVSPAYTLTVGEPYDPVLINAIFGALVLGAIVGSDIATQTIEGSNIATNTIEGANIMANTIGASHIASNTISADHLMTDSVTATKVLAGSITADKIATGTITAEKMNITSLSSLSANLGEVTAGTLTAPTIQTSANPGVSRVLMNSSGITGYSSTLGQVFRLPTDGNAPTFASGIIESCTIIDSTMISNDFKTSDVLPWIELSTTGVAYRESGSGGLYGTAVYGTGTYGAGVTAYYANSSKPILSIELERTLADIRLFNRTENATGAAELADLIAVDGGLKICTSAGTPGTYTALFQGDRDNVLKAGKKLIFDGA